MAEFDDKYVKCPYYLSNNTEEQRKREQIRCEGVSGDNSISLEFGSAIHRKVYKEKHCYSVTGCCMCLIHKMLDRKYGEDR